MRRIGWPVGRTWTPEGAFSTTGREGWMGTAAAGAVAVVVEVLLLDGLGVRLTPKCWKMKRLRSSFSCWRMAYFSWAGNEETKWGVCFMPPTPHNL